jgi:hypothetical protein
MNDPDDLISVTEKELPFDPDAKLYCNGHKCRVKCNRLRNMVNHVAICTHDGHGFFEKCRNRVIIRVRANDAVYSVYVENVNKFNLQPSRIFFNKESRVENCNESGLVVSHDWAMSSHVDDVYNSDVIEMVDTPNIHKITEIPSKVNIRFQ